MGKRVHVSMNWFIIRLMETKKKMRKREKFPSENFRYIKRTSIKLLIICVICFTRLSQLDPTWMDVSLILLFFLFFFFLHFNLKAGSIHHRSSSFSLPKLFEPVTNGHRIGYQRSLSINANQLGNGSRTLESLQSDTECSCFVRTIVTLLVRFELLVQPH